MTENGKLPVRRLVGEAAVIVLSILLAFAIDALWAQQQLRLEERDVLAALEAEFSANLEQVDTVIARHESGRDWVKMLVALPADSIDALPQATISEIMLATSNPWTFDPILGTTDALVGAGKLGIVRDPRLREALTSFENFVSDAEEDADFMRSFAEDIWKAQIPHGGPWTDPETEISTSGVVGGLDFIRRATPADLLSVRSDREFMGLVSWFHLNAGYYLTELGRIRSQISTVLDLIDESS